MEFYYEVSCFNDEEESWATDTIEAPDVETARKMIICNEQKQGYTKIKIEVLEPA